MTRKETYRTEPLRELEQVDFRDGVSVRSEAGIYHHPVIGDSQRRLVVKQG